jgi:hypothetical protein
VLIAMKIAEVLSTEADANDAQLQAIKQQEKTIKRRKAQLKVNSAIRKLNAIK